MVLGCGSNVVDKFFKVRALPRPGEKGYFQSPTRIVEGSVVGGVTVNHLAWASMLGVPTGLLALQGSDSSGVLIREKMDSMGMSTKFIEVSDQFTTAESLIFLQEDGERSIIMASGATSLINAEVSLRLAKHFPAVCRNSIFSTEISQVPLSGVATLLEAASAVGNLTVLDVDVTPTVAIEQAKLGTKEELLKCVRLADVLKPSHIAACELIEMLTGKKVPVEDTENYSKLTQQLLQATNAKLVALTSGSQGCVIALKSDDGTVALVKSPPHEIPAVLDATGAGDAFLGGLIAGLYTVVTQGRSVTSLTPAELDRLGNLANATGAACCRVLGGLPEASSLALVSQFAPFAGELMKRVSFPNTVSSNFSTVEGVATSLQSDTSTAAHLASTIDVQKIQGVAKVIHETVRTRATVFISGTGKSGIVGQRLAASLRSLSIQAQFIAASEWAHGDLGAVRDSPVVIFLSHSGNTAECVEAGRLLKDRCQATFVSIVGSKGSALGQLGKSLEYQLPQGAVDPFGVPTSSIVAQEMMGNALIRELIALQQKNSVDVGALFRRNHPGGAIGAKKSE